MTCIICNNDCGNNKVCGFNCWNKSLNIELSRLDNE